MNELWDIQYKFNEKFFKKNNIDFNNISNELKNHYSKEFILHISREIFEVLNEIPFKMHREYKTFKSKRKNIVEELIDVQKYLWGLFQIWDVDYNEFCEEFKRKSNVVQQRYNQEFNINFDKNKKIILFDIDGVIADYPNCFIEFINKKLSTNYKTLFDIKNNYDKKTRIDFKDEYRNSGIKKNIPVIKDTVEFINNIDRNKYYIVILTARPYSKYFRIYADTLEWLKNIDIYYDMILWDEKKDRRILENFDINQIEFMVEDNLYYANKVSELNIKVYILNNEYNIGNCLKNVYRVNSTKEIII